MYLTRELVIKPIDEKEAIDEEIYEIKESINFGEIIKLPTTLKNEIAYEYLENLNVFVPKVCNYFDNTDNIDFYWSNHIINGYMLNIMFIHVHNSHKLTRDSLINPEKQYLICEHNLDVKYIADFLNRTIRIYNNIHDDNYFLFDVYKINLLKTLSEPRIYDLTPLSFQFKLKTKLNDYQLDNINWILNSKRNPVYEFVTNDRLYFFPDGRAWCMNTLEFITEMPKVKFKGKIIIDDNEFSKTQQVFALAITEPNDNDNTLILVPDHLKICWEKQFALHFVSNPANITILDFTEYGRNHNIKYKQIIVDEIDQLYTDENNEVLFAKLCETGAKYKFGFTSTQLRTEYSLTFLIRFLTEIDFIYNELERFKYHRHIYTKILRKNTP